MIDEPDFSIEGEDSAPVAQPAPPLPPKVVIEYRDRGFPSLLVPPLLILIAVLVILVSRRETPLLVPPPAPPKPTALVDTKPDRPTSAEPVSSEPAAASNESPSPPPAPRSLATASALPELPDLDELMPSLAASSVSPPAPADRHVGPEPSPAVETKPEAPAAEKVKPLHVNEPESIRKPVAIAKLAPEPAVVADPPRPPEAAAPDPVPDVTKEQILNEIRDEAERKAAEIRKIEELKPQMRFLEVSRMVKKAEANRLPFHKALKDLLKSRRTNVGQDIESLCNEYGRTTVPEIRIHIGKILSTTYARSPLKVKVEIMRAWGYPETMIFDYVANGVDRLLGTPGGPRDGDDVRVRAARILVAIPPATAAGRSVAGSASVPSSTNGQRPH
ncbi:hypothetical protein V5E97_38250 [Singulisphaera sp. Ch08]|uniref:Uncharacterized protein n=1 Tax=Singulisphaera sp. Ch08 TaxID=3120278 RepID=A0AAU7CGA1_9BACT